MKKNCDKLFDDFLKKIFTYFGVNAEVGAWKILLLLRHVGASVKAESFSEHHYFSFDVFTANSTHHENSFHSPLLSFN